MTFLTLIFTMNYFLSTCTSFLCNRIYFYFTWIYFVCMILFCCHNIIFLNYRIFASNLIFVWNYCFFLGWGGEGASRPAASNQPLRTLFHIEGGKIFRKGSISRPFKASNLYIYIYIYIYIMYVYIPCFTPLVWCLSPLISTFGKLSGEVSIL